MKSITFGTYNSETSLGLVIQKDGVSISPPTIQEHKVSVVGRNGTIDLSEYLLGKVAYDDRAIDYSFWLVCDDSQAIAKISDILNKIHGKRFDITHSDDPNYKWQGRVTVAGTSRHGEGVYEVLVSATVNPFKIHKTTGELSL